MGKWASNRTSFVARILTVMLLYLILCTDTPAEVGWTITQLTNNTLEDGWPDISGTNVVWGGAGEIYMATHTPDVIPAPGAVLLAGLGGGLVGWLRRRRVM